MSKLLTPLELKVMNILWKMKKGFVKELLTNWPDKPAPAYNTVSTTVRILQEKEYVDYDAFGRTHQYYPVVSKMEYQKRLLVNIVENAFAGSASSLVSALMSTDKIGESEIEVLQDLIENQKSDSDLDV